jgi:biopolymer transport protein ExbD
MVSTTFTKETHLTLDLPEASGKKLEEQAKQIEIIISADGRYAINGRSLVNNQIEIIMKALEEESDGDYTLPMIITADANTSHQAVVTAMDAAGRMGFSNLSLTTQEPGKE